MPTRTLLFRVGDGGTVYGCDIGDVQEIIPLRRATRLPGAPPYVRGLLNVRGTIVTVLDLGVRLEPWRSPSVEGSILLVRFGATGLAGIVVEEVLDVRGVELETTEVATDAADAAVLRGVAQLDDAPVIVLDLQAMIQQVLLPRRST
jgi:purine-binding chemotaxis protein CheW